MFRNCDSPVRLFIAPNQVTILDDWERETLRTGFSDAQYVELVAARPCDTVHLYPHRDIHPQTGAETKMVFISLAGEAKPAGSMRWCYYKTVHSIHRGENGLVLCWQNIEISRDEDQGQGIGARILVAQARAAYRMGFRTIECFAERKPNRNGYYTWPRLGFDWEIHPRIQERLPLELRALPRLSDIMASAETRAMWKEYGVSVPADFETAPDSASMHTLHDYFDERGWAWPDDSYTTPSLRHAASLRFDRATEEPCRCP